MPDALTPHVLERAPLPEPAGPLPQSATSTEPPASSSADRIALLLMRALLDPATASATPEVMAGRHGRLRARENRTLGELLGEYHALRRRMAGLDEVDIDLHSALDRVGAAAANAFCSERARQHEVVRLGRDHDLRGCVNALRLAAFVQRETGRDTTDIVERHTASLSALLERARAAPALCDDRALQPVDMPPDDLSAACRRQISDWNHRHAGPACRFTSTSACHGHFDTARVRETLDAMVGAAARQAGDRSVLTASLGSTRGMALVTVEGQAPAPGTGPGVETPAGEAEVDADDPLVWMLGQQTAADHHGTLETESGGGRVIFRLALRHDPAAIAT